MKRILLFMIGATCLVTAYSQSPTPLQGDGRFTTLNVPNVKNHTLQDRATGTYFLDYLEYDRNFLGSTINNGVYGNLCFTRVDTAYGGVPFVAEYYDTLITSVDLQAWNSIGWNNVANMTVDSVFILLNVDNSSGMTDFMKMKIVTPTVVTNGSGNWRNFNANAPIWQDSTSTTIDVGTITGSQIGFNVLAFAPGATVTGPFAVMYEFYGPPTDTCRLLWSYPTDGAGCPTSSLADNPQAWELYPKSFYNICLGGQAGGPVQIPSIGLPRITSNFGYAYYADCQAPASPYINDTQAQGFDNAKNPFQHWNIWAVVTISDNMGIAEQSEKGIKVFAYPNPATDLLNINFTLLQPANNVMLTVTDLSGRVAMSRNLGAFATGKNTSNIDINLESGVYTYTLNVDGTLITRKFIVGK